MIKLEKIYKNYKNINVLDNISLTLNKGEITAIIGPSGSGKSTVLNLIGLLDTPNSGVVYFEDKNVSDLTNNQVCDVRANDIGFIVQNFALVNNFTVFENIKLGIDMLRLPEKNKKILKVLKDLKILDLKDKKVNQLSGGQQQRVAIARALVKKPMILLCDEPTGNLDEENTKIIMDLIKGTMTKQMYCVIVTHDLSVASLCDRVIKVQNKNIQENL